RARPGADGRGTGWQGPGGGGDYPTARDFRLRVQVYARHVAGDLPGRPFRLRGGRMRPVGPIGAPRPQARRVFPGRFSLDTGGRTLLFRGKYPAGYDGDEPASPIGTRGRGRISGPVRT